MVINACRRADPSAEACQGLRWVRVVARRCARSVLTLSVFLIAGCSELSGDPSCTPRALSVTADAAAAAAGTEVTVSWAYQAGGWAFNAMDLEANGALMCSQRLASTVESGACQWATNGLPPGTYDVRAVAWDSPVITIGSYCEPQAAQTTVELLAVEPEIVGQPTDVALVEGASGTFEVRARGSGPFSYQWQRADAAGEAFVDLGAETQARLVVSAVSSTDDGALFRVTVSNSAGSVTSNAALLTVTSAACTVSAVTPLCAEDAALAVSTFSTAPMHSVALPGSAAAAFPGYVYGLARTVSPRIDELVQFAVNGDESLRATVALDAGVLKMGAGAFAGRMFAADRALPADAPDGVYEILPGPVATLFSTVGGVNPDPHGIAFGTGGSFGSFMYAANPTAGTTDPRAHRAIVRIRPDGTLDGALATHPEGPYYIAFPTAAASAAYGDYLYFTLLDSHRLLRVSAAGAVETFAEFAVGERPIDLAFGRGGALGNSLYVAVFHPDGGLLHRLTRVLPDGTVQTVARGLRGFRFDIDPDPPHDLFLANEGGGIVRVLAKP